MRLCLIIDVAGVFGAQMADPGAVAMLGELRRIEALVEAQPGTAQFTLTLICFGAGPTVFAEVAAATGDPGKTIVVAPAAPAAPLCSDMADRIILLTGPAGTGLEGCEIWRVGDPVSGIGTLADVERRIRECMRLPVPRPMDPARMRGALVALPAAGSRPIVLACAYRDAGVDWLALGRLVILFVPDSGQATALARLLGARFLGGELARSELYLAGDGGAALVADSGMAVFKVTGGDPPKGATPWMVARRRSWP